MEAHDFRMKLLDEIAHFFVERSARRAWNGSIGRNVQLNVISVQALSPAYFPSMILLRRLVTEEIRIDGTRCSSPDSFKLLACVFHAEQRTSKRAESSSFGDGNDHVGQRCPCHRCLNNRQFDAE